MATKLAAVPEVDIDDAGRFKYILIRVHVINSPAEGPELSKVIVRGYSRSPFHADIYDEVQAALQEVGGLEAECLGGGRIEHFPDTKKLMVYGYSQGFGKADHSQAKTLLKTKYSDYVIEVSDEGY